MKVQIFQIFVNDGRREIDQEAVHGLADSISELGLLNPIIVDQGYTLIAGLHRLEAAKLLGWTEIECTVSDLEGLMAELAEIDENFVRKSLSEIEYGDLLLRRKEIYEALHPETGHGKRNGQTSKDCNLQSLGTKAFIQETADQLGVNKSTIARRIQTAKNLTPETKSIIRDTNTKISKTNALKLSRLAPEQQKEAATQLVAGDIKSIDEYQSVPTRPEPPPDEGQTEAPAAPPVSDEACYATTRDSVNDLKNPDKDRSYTPDTFLMSFSFSLRRFCQNISTYADDEYTAVFPALTQDHLNQLHEEISSVHIVLDDLFNKIERRVHQ